MKLKSIFLCLILFMTLCQIAFVSAATALFVIAKRHNLETATQAEFDTIFNLYSGELAADALLNHDEMMRARLSEIEKREGVEIRYDRNDSRILPLISSSSALSSASLPATTFERVYDLKLSGMSLGKLRLSRRLRLLERNDYLLMIFFVSIPVCLLIFGGRIIYKWAIRKIISPIEQVVALGSTGEMDSMEGVPLEIEQIVKSFERLWSAMKKQTREAAIAEIAAQFAHDIRSPLAVFEELIKDIPFERPEQKNLLMHASKRINEIAVKLLARQRPTLNQPAQRAESLFLVIKDMVHEKELQCMNRNIKIEFANSRATAHLFAIFDLGDIQRILSNLINNSIEAIPTTRDGSIIISLREVGRMVELEIRDNGQGINPDKMKYLGQKGYSSKESESDSGTGLGLYHAISTVKSWGGEVHVTSEHGAWTRILLALEKAATPNWFCSAVDLSQIDQVVLIDDEESNLAIWHAKIAQQNSSQKHFPLMYHSTIKEFLEAYAGYRQYSDRILFVFDNNFFHENICGIEMIERLRPPRALLSTFGFYDLELRRKCETLGIKMLPKPLVELTPVVSATAMNSASVVLLDDDRLVHQMWQYWAQETSVKLSIFDNVDKLFLRLRDFPNEIPLYVDFHLNDNKRNGLMVASELAKRGYENIHICTGDECAINERPTYIKSVRNKSPPDTGAPGSQDHFRHETGFPD
ncbi:MAG: hypothetical protein C5B49_05575 [Bdellovibrio sp.]|nr:MAG: hypothetical protein C5B49_05575 [Bdellovibrio sp.]